MRPQGRRFPAPTAHQLPPHPERRVPSPEPGAGSFGAEQVGTSGKDEDALNFPSSSTARAAPSRAPDRPASRLPRAPGRPLAHPHAGRYSHGDAFAPGCAAGKLSDPHRQWQSGTGSSQTGGGGAAGLSCPRPRPLGR